MSQQSALSFLAAVQQDSALRLKLSQLASDDIMGVIDVALLSGYEFSRDDYLKAVREYAARETVAGGMSRIPGFNQL